MRKKILFFLLSYLSALHAQCEPICESDTNSKQFFLRHIEPRGIGYKDGYTTLEAFSMTSGPWRNVYPYLDLRAHLFNNGKFASNIGVGGRGFGTDRIWGGNVYYDLRNSRKITFNQISCGLETLGAFWDFFLNGYLVIGKRNSPTLSTKFDHFEGHSLFLKRKINSAMSGADATVRLHFLKCPKWDTYLDVGPYYYHGSHGKNMLGGKASLALVIAKYLFIEGSTSYDRLFKWIGQGAVGLSLSFGCRVTVEKNRVCDPCLMADRLMQIPLHNEIIVETRNHRIAEAINPATGAPYFFWFVNNLSSSNGTFESPYPTLALAQAASKPGDILYIFRGNGNPYEGGIILQENQQLLGSGIEHDLLTQLGDITIPALSSGFPLVTNTTGIGITLANNNLVSGMHVNGTRLYGISGTGITNGTIRNNIITNVNQIGDATDRGGVNLLGQLSGSFIIDRNTIQETATAPRMLGIFITPGFDGTVQSGSNCNISILNNQILTPKDGIELKPNGTSVVQSRIANNNITITTNERAFFLEGHHSGKHNYVVENNTFQCTTATGIGLLVQANGDSTTASSSIGVIQNNSFANYHTGLKIDAKGAGFVKATIIGNSLSNNNQFDFNGKIDAGNTNGVCLFLQNNSAPALGYVLENAAAGATFNAVLSNNIGPVSETGAITHNPTCP